MATLRQDLGPVTAYAYAVSEGYTGTEEEFAEVLANFADSAEQVAADAAQVALDKGAVHDDKEAVDSAEGRVTSAVNTFTTTTAPNAVTAVENAGAAQIGLVEAEGTRQIGLVADKGTEQVGTVSSEGTTQIGLVEAKGTEVIASIPGDYSTLQGDIASTYSSSSTYAVGDYVLYSGQLYRCITAISTAEAWTPAKWTAVALGDDVTDLKSALTHKVDLPYILEKEPITILNGYFTAGGYTANSSFKSAKESVTEGETIYVSGSGTTYTYAYYFVNDGGTVISQAQTALEMNDYELVVPTGATYIEINSTGTNKSIAVKRGVYEDSFMVGVDGVDFVNYSKQYLDSTMANVGRYWNNGSMSYVADDKWIAFDAFTLPAGTYYSYNIGNIYKKVGNTISEITKTNITGISYLHTWTIAEESLIMITAVYGAESNSVVVGDTLNLPITNAIKYYNIRFKENVLPSNIIVVDKNGNGDYTEIQDAIDSIYTDTEDNPFTILVMPAEYGKIDMHRRGSPVHDLRYISIIGTDRDRCIISDDKGNYLSPTANIRTNGVIRNLSFINTTDNYDPTQTQEHAYAVHDDFGICDVTYENCYMYCEAGPAIGIGMADGKRMRFLNCEFICNENEGEKEGWIGAFFAHSANDASNDQSIEIKNSIAVNKVNTKGFCISNNVENSIFDVLLIGNVSVGTSGANAYFEGHINFGYSALNNFEIPT